MSVQIRACYVVAAQSDHMDRRQVFGKEGKKNPRPLTDFDDWSQPISTNECHSTRSCRMFPQHFRFFLSGLLLASMGLVLGEASPGRYDVLKGTQGQSACTLQDIIVEKCTTPSTRRDFSPSSILDRDLNDTDPVPSKCTCNAIFFNIWSACCYSTGNTTLPNFTQWMESCKTNSVNMDSGTNLGISIPPWAKLLVPGNTTFNLQKAVTLVNFSKVRWTTVQIVLPIIAAVTTLLLSVVVPLVYRRKFLRGDRHERLWPKGFKRLRLRHRVVTTIDRHDTWQIDGPESAFVNFAPSAEKDISHGPLLPNLDLELGSTDIHEPDKKLKTIPSSSSKPLTVPHSFRLSTRSPVRLPWKRRPPQIKLVPATSRFRVDDVNRSIYTCSSNANTEEGAKRFSQMDEAPEPGDDDYILPDDDETTDLITASERAERESQDVILISKGGRDFTVESGSASVNSHIKIESPSVSSASPRSTMQPVSAKPTLHIPIPPPPPSHAAPAPPIMPQSLRQPGQSSGGNRARPLPYVPPSFLPPIREASTPARSFSSSDVSINRSPAIRRRPSNPESLSSLHTSPESLNLTTSNQSNSSYSNLRRTASQNSIFLQALGSWDDIYMEVSTNEHDQGPAVDDNSSLVSRHFTPPVQAEPRQLQPVRKRPPLDTATSSPKAVHGAGYPRTYF